MTVTTAGSGRDIGQLRAAAGPALRTLTTVTLIGLVCGVLVCGVLARLAMFLLFRLNTSVQGVTSDDGFVMGQFTVSGSLNLALVAGPLLGVAGAGFYVALRGLAVGPPWFRLLSLSLGPGVVIGSLIVHPTGVDFALLDPLWLAVALFVLLPTGYVVLLRVLAERALAGPPWPRAATYVGLAAWVPLLPMLAVLVLGWAALRLLRQAPRTASALRHPAAGWAARAGLAAVFVAAVVDIAANVRALT